MILTKLANNNITRLNQVLCETNIFVNLTNNNNTRLSQELHKKRSSTTSPTINNITRLSMGQAGFPSFSKPFPAGCPYINMTQVQKTNQFPVVGTDTQCSMSQHYPNDHLGTLGKADVPSYSKGTTLSNRLPLPKLESSSKNQPVSSRWDRYAVLHVSTLPK